MPHRDRRGWVLLEVLLALIILGISAASLAVLMRETATALERASDQERRLETAEQLLNRYALRSAEELDRSIGRWSERGLGMRVSRLGPTLFEVLVVAPSGLVVLETSLYRPRTNAQP